MYVTIRFVQNELINRQMNKQIALFNCQHIQRRVLIRDSL